MTIDAILCDAATVREGLLNVLGGGITRIWRDTYPSPMGTQLALLLHSTNAEMGKPHKLGLTMNHENGDKIADVSLDFSVAPNPGNRPSEVVTVPLVASFQQQNLPREGGYVITMTIDGETVRTLNFVAAKQPKKAAAGSAKG